MQLRNLLRRLRLRSVQVDDERARRSVDNIDAGTAAQSQHQWDPFIGGAGGAPPGWVKTDEGRPQH